MENRLQILHHTPQFQTREEAMNYALGERNNGYFSLYAEPLVMRYGEDEENPHIILGIGAKTNESPYPQDNKICFIDIDKTEEEIQELAEEIEAAVKALTLSVIDSDTLDLSVIKEESGTTLSGNVRVAQSHIFDGVVRDNIILPTQDGIFAYVNLEYDENAEKFTFTVNGVSKDFQVNKEDYVASGEYSIYDEAIHLHRKLGGEVIIPMRDLIGEWKTEGDASTTPIVLYRDERTSGGTHVDDHEDILRADVRIYDDANNILTKAGDGKYLFVDGRARNIAYWSGSTKTNVQDALDAQLKVSSDSSNIINVKNGQELFANVTLTYAPDLNKLTFTKTTNDGGTVSSDIELVGVQFLDDITYDSTREVVVIRYTDNQGQQKRIEIPVHDIIEEIDVDNTNHTVSLTKTRVVSGGPDLISADVVIGSKGVFPTQILEVINNSLVVKGESTNIKHEDGVTVADAIEQLKSDKNALSSHVSTIEATIGDGFTTDAHETVTYKVNALDDRIDSLEDESVFSVTAADSSINVNNSDAQNPKVGVAISNEVANIIQLSSNGGIKAEAALTYSADTNTLYFTTTGNRQTAIPLVGTSIITNMYYDASTEELVIQYNTAGGGTGETRVAVSAFFDEWEVDNEHSLSIRLTKNDAQSPSGKDKLTAELLISSREDNIAQIQDNALYVSGAQIQANKNAISALTDVVATKVDSVGAKDTSIVVDNTDSENPKVGVAIKGGEKNIIKNTLDGINAEVSLDYDVATNTLTFVTSSDEAPKVMPLLSTSVITSIEYDKNTEELIIKYNTASGQTGETRVSVSAFFTEWEVENPTSDSAIRLVKSEHSVSGTDKLSAYVRVSEDTKNIITIKDNAIFVDGTQISANTNAIAALQASVATLAANTAATQTALNTEITNRTNADTALANDLADEAVRAQNAETALNTALVNAQTALNTAISNEEHRAITKENELYSSITAVNASLANEISRSTARDEQLTLSATTLNSNVSNLSTQLANETSRAQAAEQENRDRSNAAISSAQTITDRLNEEIATRSASDTTISNSLANEVSRATTAEGTITTNLNAEVARSTAEDTRLYNQIVAEHTRATSAEQSLSAYVADNIVTVDNTPTLNLEKTNNTIKGVVQIASSEDNIITAPSTGSGIYATVDIDYNGSTNVLTLKTSGGRTKDIPLNAGSIVENITYDSANRQFVITYKTATGESRTITVDARGLFPTITVPSDQTSGVVLNAQVTSDGYVISGRVPIAQIQNNMLENVNGALYVNNSGLTEMENQIQVVSSATVANSGLIQTVIDSCGLESPNGTYHREAGAYFISGATNIAEATVLLDRAVADISEVVNNEDFRTTYSVKMNRDTSAIADIITSEIQLAHSSGQINRGDNITDVAYNPGELQIDNLLRIVHLDNSMPDIDKFNGLYFDGSIDYGTVSGNDTP